MLPEGRRHGLLLSGRAPAGFSSLHQLCTTTLQWRHLAVLVVAGRPHLRSNNEVLHTIGENSVVFNLVLVLILIQRTKHESNYRETGAGRT